MGYIYVLIQLIREVTGPTIGKIKWQLWTTVKTTCICAHACVRTHAHTNRPPDPQLSKPTVINSVAHLPPTLLTKIWTYSRNILFHCYAVIKSS
jgi:hypothetical protein